MKKVKVLFGIVLIVFMGVFSACEEDGEEIATIDIEPTSVPDSLEAGVESTVSFSIFTDENLESIELRKGTATLVTKTEDFKEKTADNFSYTGVLADTADAGKTLTFALIVTDNKANEETYNFDLPVKEIVEEETEINLTSYSDVEVEVAVGDGSNASLFSVENGQVYVVNNITSNNEGMIDFVYAFSNLKQYTNQLLSPAETPSSDYLNNVSLPNTTNMAKVTDVTFEDVDGNAIAENISGLSETVMSIQEGDVIAFVTEAGHKGYLHIKTVAGSSGNSDEYVIFDVKAVLAEDMP